MQKLSEECSKLRVTRHEGVRLIGRFGQENVKAKREPDSFPTLQYMEVEGEDVSTLVMFAVQR